MEAQQQVTLQRKNVISIQINDTEVELSDAEFDYKIAKLKRDKLTKRLKLLEEERDLLGQGQQMLPIDTPNSGDQG